MPATLIQTTDVTTGAKPAPQDSRVNILGLSKKELQDAMADIGVEPKKQRMRASQIFQWMYHHGVRDFSAMTNIAKPMQAKLSEYFTLDRPEIIERQVSVDGTRKYLIRMAPGIEVESVFIPDVSKTGALCVSSQVGCTLTCTFCHTGTQRLVRNLTAREIILQIIIARDDLDEWPTQQENRKLTNIVFMGMGEPLYNTEAVCQAVDIMSNETGLSIGRRRVTVSTSGVVPEIAHVGRRTGAMLAISLHAANDALREKIMPINRKYPLAELIQACRDYPGLSNARRITFEYVMLKGINDTAKHARELITLLQGIPAKVNLIPFNPWPGSDYECSDWETIEKFGVIVNKSGLAAPIRTPRGRDILAACGQLKSESEKMRASERRALEKAARSESVTTDTSPTPQQGLT